MSKRSLSPRKPPVSTKARKSTKRPRELSISDARIFACIQKLNAVEHGVGHVTKMNYVSTLNTIRNGAHGIADPQQGEPTETDVLSTAIMNFSETQRRLQESDLAPRTRKKYVDSILAVYNHADCSSIEELQKVHPQWRELQKTLRSGTFEMDKSQTKTIREVESWVPREEALQKLKEVSQLFPNSQKHVLLSLLINCPPLRASDLANIRIVSKDDPLANMYCDSLHPTEIASHRRSQRCPACGINGHLEDSCAVVQSVCVIDGTYVQLRIRAHKTFGSHGVIVRDFNKLELPDYCSMLTLAHLHQTSKVIRESLEEEPRSFLFLTSTGKPFSGGPPFTEYMNKTLKQLFGRHATTNTFRHSYITAFNELPAIERSLHNKLTLAKLMGHSGRQQDLYIKLK